MLYVVQHSDEGNVVVKNCRKKDSCVKDSKEAEEADEAALGLDSCKNKDVDQVEDDSKNTGRW